MNPAALLAGSDDIEAAFTLVDGGEKDGLEWVRAVPRNREAGFDSISMGFDQRFDIIDRFKLPCIDDHGPLFGRQGLIIRFDDRLGVFIPTTPGGKPVGIIDTRGSFEVILPGMYSCATRSGVLVSHLPKST